MPPATVSTSHSKPPTLSEGEITPLNTRQFEEACLGYFRTAKDPIPSEKQVSRILGCFTSLSVNNWISLNADDLMKKNFTEFMAAFRLEFLDSDWSEKLDAQLRVSKQNGRPFKDWSIEFRHKALILAGSPEELSDAEIKKLMTALMDEHLRNRTKKYKTEVNFKKWLEAVADEAESIRGDLAHYKTLSRPFASTPRSSPAPKRSRANDGSSQVRARAPEGWEPMPSLTAEEREVLRRNGGCYKCRVYDADHMAADCPVEFPSGRGYKERTREHAEAYRRKRSHQGTSSHSSSRRSSTGKSGSSSKSSDSKTKSKSKSSKKVAAVDADSDVEFDRATVAMAKIVDYESSSDGPSEGEVSDSEDDSD